MALSAVCLSRKRKVNGVVLLKTVSRDGGSELEAGVARSGFAVIASSAAGLVFKKAKNRV